MTTVAVERSRRELLIRVARGAVRSGLAGAALVAVGSHVGRPPSRRSPEEASRGILRPPGALAEPAFLGTCLRCSLCAEACGPGCIRIFGPSEGRVAGTPYIVARERGCNLCLDCTVVCPSGSLRELEDPAQADMGLAVVDERLCVSLNGTGVCGACHTVCPLRGRAITQGLRNAPTVHGDHCVGCGLCEEACIVDDRTAIHVVSDRIWS